MTQRQAVAVAIDVLKEEDLPSVIEYAQHIAQRHSRSISASKSTEERLKIADELFGILPTTITLEDAMDERIMSI